MNFNPLTRLGIAGALTLAQWALCLTLLGATQPLAVSDALANSAMPSPVTASLTAGTTADIRGVKEQRCKGVYAAG